MIQGKVCSDTKIDLTIAIPTYNRVDKLQKQIQRLLPQLSAQDRIIISDNATPNVNLKDIIERYSDPRIRLSQNKVNVGANANIAKCFELVDTEFMWLLSDDDDIVHNALDIIRCAIEKYNADFYNFSTKLLRRSRGDLLCSGINDYVNSIGSGISNHLLMSNNIYRVRSVLPYLSIAYWAAYINAPHLAPIMMALQNGSDILLSGQEVVKWGHSEKDKAGGWRFSNLYNLLFLPDVITDSILRKKAIKCVMISLPAPERLVAQLAHYKKQKHESNRVDSYARRILSIYIENGSLVLKLRVVLLKIFIKFPVMYLYFLSIILKKVKNADLDNYIQNNKFDFFI